MSFDVSLSIDTGSAELTEVVNVGNMTYNVSPMFYRAMGVGLRDLNSCRAEGVLYIIEHGVEDMRTSPQKYKAMNPENGWGSYESALEFLETLRKACKKNPKCVIEVS